MRSHARLSVLILIATLAAGCSQSQSSPQMLPNSTSSNGILPNDATPKTPGYAITDLGALPGESSSEVGMSSQNRGGALNDRGQATGASSGPSGDIATLFGKGGTTNINTLGASVSLGNAINASGQIAGEESSSNDPCLCFHAFLYDNGTMKNLEPRKLFPGGSIAYGINKSGQVVGQGFLGSSSFHAFLYTNGKMTDLNPLDGFQSVARSINDSGEIIGSSTGTGSGGAATWLYANGTITNLSPTNSGYFIDNAGDIVGENGSNHAALYRNGTWKNLGGFSGSDATIALGVNTSGQVIGTAYFPVQSYHPFRPGKHVALVFNSRGPVDLDTLIPANSGFTLTDATAINDKGQIAADATNSSGNRRAVLLTPK
jgi:probable HAF family extracellular repeat protein